jgi:hypothetical protein
MHSELLIEMRPSAHATAVDAVVTTMYRLTAAVAVVCTTVFASNHLYARDDQRLRALILVAASLKGAEGGMRRRGKPDPERLILNLRLKDLNRLIVHRHGGDAATYTLPDDDAAPRSAPAPASGISWKAKALALGSRARRNALAVMRHPCATR